MSKPLRNRVKRKLEVTSCSQCPCISKDDDDDHYWCGLLFLLDLSESDSARPPHPHYLDTMHICGEIGPPDVCPLRGNGALLRLAKDTETTSSDGRKRTPEDNLTARLRLRREWKAAGPE